MIESTGFELTPEITGNWSSKFPINQLLNFETKP